MSAKTGEAVVFRMPDAPVVRAQKHETKKMAKNQEKEEELEGEEEKETKNNEKNTKPYVVNKAAVKTKCRGPKNGCKGVDNTIAKGELRLGTRAKVDERDSIFYRHIACVTSRMLTNKNVTADTMNEFIDYSIDDGTRMSITQGEARRAENALRVLLGSAPLPEIEEEHEEDEKAEEEKQPKKKRAKKATI